MRCPDDFFLGFRLTFPGIAMLRLKIDIGIGIAYYHNVLSVVFGNSSGYFAVNLCLIE